MADSLPVHFGRGGGRQGNYHRGGGGRGRYQHRGGGGRGRGRYNNHRGRGRGGRGRGGRHGGGRGRWNRADELFEEHGTPTDTSVSIAVQGCCHGELETIYARLSEFQQQTGRKIDVLICCGDFQSLRTPADFHSYAAPPKYRQLGGFVKYYSGVLVAPILTIFIGGNHESSQALQELYYGGWVAPNIYYMGAAGVVSVKGVRIGGISGIYKSHDYHKGHFERPPYDRSTLRSVYHVRSLPVFRMKSLSGQQKQRLDVMMSHDWPQGIENHGNIRYLLQKKPYFREEVRSNTLGSPANHEILQAIKPKLWFSAHLHVGFRATVRHDDQGNNKKDDNNKKAQPTLSTTDLVPSQAVKPATSPSKEEDTNEETKDGADEAPATSPAKEETTKDGDSAAPPAANDSKETTEEAAEDPSQQLLCQPVSETRFVSLDKCLPGRPYFSVTHVEPSQPSNNHAVPTLEYDPEWLAILRKTHDLTEPNNRRQVLPKDLMPVTQAEIDAVKQLLLESRNDLAIPHNFSVTVPPSGHSSRALPPPLPRMGNPQTDELLELLKLDHLITIPYDPSCLQGLDWSQPPQGPPPPPQPDDNEIDIDGDDDEEEDVHKEETVDDGKGKGVADENEIDVDEVSEDDDGGSSPKRPRLES